MPKEYRASEKPSDIYSLYQEKYLSLTNRHKFNEKSGKIDSVLTNKNSTNKTSQSPCIANGDEIMASTKELTSLKPANDRVTTITENSQRCADLISKGNKQQATTRYLIPDHDYHLSMYLRDAKTLKEKAIQAQEYLNLQQIEEMKSEKKFKENPDSDYLTALFMKNKYLNSGKNIQSKN